MPTIHVAGPVAAELNGMLAEELGEDAIEAEREADLLVSVEVGRFLSLRLIRRPEEVLVTEEFSLAHGLEPALRAAVLLITDVTRSIGARRVEPVRSLAVQPENAPKSSGRFELSAGVAGFIGWRPVAPRTGLWMGGDYALGPVRFGIRAAASGIGCCRLASSRVGGDLLNVVGAASVSFDLYASNAIDLGVLARVGVGWERFTGRARLERDEGTNGETALQSVSAAGLFLATGLALRIRLVSPLSLLLAGGINLQVPRLVVEPPEIAGPEPIADSGPVAPFLELGVRVELF